MSLVQILMSVAFVALWALAGLAAGAFFRCFYRYSRGDVSLARKSLEIYRFGTLILVLLLVVAATELASYGAVSASAKAMALFGGLAGLVMGWCIKRR